MKIILKCKIISPQFLIGDDFVMGPDNICQLDFLPHYQILLSGKYWTMRWIKSCLKMFFCRFGQIKAGVRWTAGQVCVHVLTLQSLYCTVLYCTVLYCTVLYLAVPACRAAAARPPRRGAAAWAAAGAAAGVPSRGRGRASWARRPPPRHPGSPRTCCPEFEGEWRLTCRINNIADVRQCWRAGQFS